ncbi:AAA family ATPase [Bradyrhizobium sp. RP6]|uniref:DNA polymerase III subunit n=1 Tax=Bradyrhizobium sp. RP6 TaxID=2489596 RepID=UPI000F5365B9|nr:AAA family ATPase [Bradyrhizobium sp. RP6]RQH09474.1 AAA family ATPase [Bradyrhizobium sp. RP6]
MESLAIRHRPKGFERVAGQGHAVEFLSQLIIEGQICRNILLYGAIGSGKTTLARIYAKALTCEQQPFPGGSPCLDCKSCRDIGAGEATNFHELDAPSYENFVQLKSKIDSLALGASKGWRRVIFIDEAQSLARYPQSFDYLLKKVEEPNEGISYCFATTAFEKISPALRSRLHCLEIRPLILPDCIKYLERIAEAENIKTSPDALALIAALGDGQPRNMLHVLEVVSRNADVTVDRVRQIYNFGYTEILTRYFIALGQGDFRRQTEIFFQWNEDAREKVRLIQVLMLSLYYKELCGLSLTIDPVIASMAPSDRAQIITAFRERLKEANLKSFWEGLIQAWPVITSDLSEESLFILITDFQRRVSAASEIVEHVPPEGPFFSPTEAAWRPPVDKMTTRQQRRGGRSEVGKDPRYLTYDQVKDLFNAASFLTQEYGCQFNIRVTVRSRLFGCDTKSEVSKLLSGFAHAFTDRLNKWIGHSHWLCVQEFEDGAVCSRIIAVGPQPDSREFKMMQKWFSNWRKNERTAGQEEQAITADLTSTQKSARKMKSHWDSVRWLCAGMNPAEPIYKRLVLPKSRQAGDLGSKRRRHSASESLTPSGMADAMQHEMEPLSAFDDEAWDHLYNGWELQEFHDRQKEKGQRQADIHAISRKYPRGDQEQDEKRKREYGELLKSWPDRYRRPRSWYAWHPPDEVD